MKSSKPAARKPEKRAQLGRRVRKRLEEHGGDLIEHRFVVPEAQDYLLERLKLPEDKLWAAKRIEANSLRILEAHTRVEQGVGLSVKMARDIIEQTAAEIPKYIERNLKTLSDKNLRDLILLEQNLKQDIGRLRRAPDDLPTTLSPEFLESAKQINFDKLRNVMGDKKFRLYMNALRRTYKVFGKRLA